MIGKKINDIDINDIEGLVTAQVCEGKTIEYKRELVVATGDERKEFLYDVSSFANTSGGDLLYGIEARDGIPVALQPITVENNDAETLRIENIIRTGINPRFSFNIRFIPAGTQNKYVLLIRIHESWNKPHRVTAGGSGKFYAGNIIAGGGRDLTPIQVKSLLPGEIAASPMPGAHAEITAITEALNSGSIPQMMGVSRAVCPNCQAFIESQGGSLLDSYTAIWR